MIEYLGYYGEPPMTSPSLAHFILHTVSTVSSPQPFRLTRAVYVCLQDVCLHLSSNCLGLTSTGCVSIFDYVLLSEVFLLVACTGTQ